MTRPFNKFNQSPKKKFGCPSEKSAKSCVASSQSFCPRCFFGCFFGCFFWSADQFKTAYVHNLHLLNRRSNFKDQLQVFFLSFFRSFILLCFRECSGVPNSARRRKRDLRRTPLSQSRRQTPTPA